MSTKSLTALETKVKNGQLVYVVYGVLEVASLELATELLTDRRSSDRSMPERNQRTSELLGINCEPHTFKAA